MEQVILAFFVDVILRPLTTLPMIVDTANNIESTFKHFNTSEKIQMNC